jgi:hypothetical protein
MLVTGHKIVLDWLQEVANNPQYENEEVIVHVEEKERAPWDGHGNDTEAGTDVKENDGSGNDNDTTVKQPCTSNHW